MINEARTTPDVPATSKVEIYRAALIEALAAAASQAGEADINSAIAALANVQGYLIAKIRDRSSRRLAVGTAEKMLQASVATFVAERLAAEMKQ